MLPTNIDLLSIGNACNLDCVHCYYQEQGLSVVSASEQEELARKIIENYPDQAIFVYPKEISTSLGVLPLLERVSQKSALSNGTILTQDMAERILESGVETIKITLFSNDSEQSFFYRAEGYHRRVIEAIRICVKAGLRVTVNSVITKTTLGSIKDLCALSHSLGVKKMELYRLKPIGNGCAKFRGDMIDMNDMMEAIVAVEEAKSLYGEDLYISFMPDFGINFYGKSIQEAKAKALKANESWTNSPYICPAIGGNYWGVSLRTGNVYWCFNAVSRPNSVIGTVDLSSGLINLHSNPRLGIDELRSKLKGNCSRDNCMYQEVCLGGCRSTAIIFAEISGDKEPFFAGMDICLTKCYEAL